MRTRRRSRTTWTCGFFRLTLAEYSIFSHYKTVSVMKEFNWDVNELETLTPMEFEIYRKLLTDELKRKKEKAEQ